MTSTYTLYGFTKSKSTNIENCMLFYEDYTNENSLHTYSTSYYKGNYFLNDFPMKMSDFEYIVKITIDTKQVYIIRSSKDIIKGFQDKQGIVNQKLLEEHNQQPINGFILYDIRTSTKDNYIPYLYLNKKCILDSRIIKRKTPIQRLWISYEKCDTYDNFECIDSQSCVLKLDENENPINFNKPLSFEDIMNIPPQNVIGCESSRKLNQLSLVNMRKVLISYKCYALTEYETQPYNTYQINNRPKPLGLWFAVGDEWLNFMLENKFNINKYKYLYEVVYNKNKLIIINDLKDLYLFSQQYGIKDNKYVSGIAWEKVVSTTKKSGIIIHPNLKTILFNYKMFATNDFDFMHYFNDMEWYLTWDVSSGVIWKKDGLKSFKLIYKQDEGKFIDY